ncbi:MAG: HMA2 domain-containing protein, partial [Hyphomicrobiales bacterium]
MTSATLSGAQTPREFLRLGEARVGAKPFTLVAGATSTPASQKQKLAESARLIEDEFGAVGIEIVSEILFADPRSALARAFYARAFAVSSVTSIAIDAAARRAEILFRPGANDPTTTVRELQAAFRGAAAGRSGAHVEVAEYLGRNSSFRLYRYGGWVSTWIVRHESPGRIRLHNPALFRRREMRQSIEAELVNTFGVDRFSTQELTGSVLVYYNPRQIQKHQIIEILDSALAKAVDNGPSPVDLDLPVSVVSVLLAAASRFAFPALTPISAAVFLYSVIPSFKGAYQVAFKEKRLGVDVLDAIVVAACLATNQIFAGSVLGLTLSISRKLVEKTE